MYCEWLKIDLNVMLSQHLSEHFPYLDEDKESVLITGYRRESFGSGFELINETLVQATKQN